MRLKNRGRGVPFVAALIALALWLSLSAADRPSDAAPSPMADDAPLMNIIPPVLNLTMDTSQWVSAKVKVLNRGGSALHINTISASCGCASATVLKDPIQPMDIGELMIRINTQNMHDSLNVIEYSIPSNASNSPMVYRVRIHNPHPNSH